MPLQLVTAIAVLPGISSGLDRVPVASILLNNFSEQVTCIIHRAEKILAKKDIIFEKFDALFLSAMTMDRIACQKIIRMWRQKKGSSPIIVGGPICCEDDIQEQLSVDLAVKGEIEQHMTEIANVFETIPNFS